MTASPAEELGKGPACHCRKHMEIEGGIGDHGGSRRPEWPSRGEDRRREGGGRLPPLRVCREREREREREGKKYLKSGQWEPHVVLSIE
jgi:hypothetical protein